MAADLQENLQLTPSRNSRIPLPKWSPKLGGKREGAGRPRLHIVKQAERDVRVSIPRDMHKIWTKYKALSGCRNDREFTKFLLDLAEKQL